MTITIQKHEDNKDIFILEQINFNTNSTVDLIISTKKHKTLAERFENYNGETPTGEYDWGNPQGEEIW